MSAPAITMDVRRVGETTAVVDIGGEITAGVFVLYADAESFTLMTPQRHMFAGWITFSAERSSGTTGLRRTLKHGAVKS
jgi:hypothetical protein